MPATPPASSGMAAYLAKNAKFSYGGGALGGLLLASDIKGILDADNKFKALLKTLKDFVLIRVLVGNVFGSIAAGIKNLVRETGSLDQALKKLGQMQAFSRGLSGLVGSLGAARQRIAALSELSSRGPFRFEELAEANKSLEVFTRGAYSSVDATKEVGLAAMATGNNITDVARAVGGFYDNLRSGQPVGEAAEQMRQMGLISQRTADDLTSMAAGGETAASVMDKLTDSLRAAGEGGATYKTELATITEEHQKAIDVLKEQFASPFTEKHVQNIQNTTEAMRAITPTVARLSQGAATLYNGFGTATSGLIKWGAQTKWVRTTVEGLLTVVGALSAALITYGIYAAATLTPILWKMGEAFAAMGVAAKSAMIAIRVASVATVWLTVAGAVLTAVGAVWNMAKAAQQVSKEFDQWAKTQADATAALLAQVAAISTLTDKNAALAASMKRINDLHKQRRDLEKEAKHLSRSPTEDKTLGSVVKDFFNVSKLVDIVTGKEEKRLAVNKKSQEINKKNTEIAKQAAYDAAHSETMNKALVEAEGQRLFQIEQTTKGIEQRDHEAITGARAQADMEGQLGDIEADRLKLTDKMTEKAEAYSKKIDPKRKDRQDRKKEITDDEEKLTKLDKQKQAVQLGAPQFSSAYLEAKAEQLRQAREATVETARLKGKPGLTGPERREMEAKIKRSRELAGPEALEQFAQGGTGAVRAAEVQAELAKKREAQRPSPEETRAVRVQRFGIETDIQRSEAQRAGDRKGVQAMEDLSRFTHHFEELRPLFGDKEATTLAARQTGADIADEYTGKQLPVSSLTAIGGGGNLPGIDQSLEIARRQEILQQQMVAYLAIISGAPEKEQQTQAVYQ